MGLDNPLHIAIVLIVVLLVFGAKRLPELGKSMGEGLRGFKESMNGEDRPTGVEEFTASDPRPVDQPEAPVAHVAAPVPAAVEPTPVSAAVEPTPVPVSIERTPVPVSIERTPVASADRTPVPPAA